MIEELTAEEEQLILLLQTSLSFNEIAKIVGTTRDAVQDDAIALYRRLGIFKRALTGPCPCV
jgi:predicted DNA-binding protein YlxM (UPF0122 family)